MWYHSLSLQLLRTDWCFHPHCLSEDATGGSIIVCILPPIDVRWYCSMVRFLFKVVEGHLVV